MRPDDPPAGAAGIATAHLDSRGRLRALLLPPEVGDPAGARLIQAAAPGETDAPADWLPLFDAAGLTAESFLPTAPVRAPPYFAEKLFAWEGAYDGQSEPRLLVHGATTAGEVVWWQVSESPLLDGAGSSGRPNSRVPLVALTLFAVVLIFGGWLAYRHFRDGRGDPRGAWRLAIAMAVANLAAWLLAGHHVAAPAQLSLSNLAVAESALLGLAFWVLYMALEPYGRRLVPRRLTSWTRLLNGRIGDPLVGRDLLLGLSISAATLAVLFVGAQSGGRLGWDFPHGLSALYGPHLVIANSLSILNVIVPLVIMSLLIAVRALVRSDRWAPLAYLLILVPLHAVANGGLSLLGFLQVVGVAALASYVGLVALLGFAVVSINLNLVPVSLDPSHWWAASSWIGIAVVLGLAGWSYRTATRAVAGPAETDG